MLNQPELESFRDLYERAIEYEGDNLYADILAPQIGRAQSLIAPLRYLQRLCDAPPASVPVQVLWNLFALSVLNDFLVLPLRLAHVEYRRFFEALGFSVFGRPSAFNPLTCEIVEVGNWPKAEEGIIVDACYWPGLRFGEMIFSRCAVDVRCHPSHGIVSGIADQSPLYFANRRMRRKCHDPSHGWGHNSRWATSLYRNYEVGGYAFFNVDAEHDLAASIHPPDALRSLPVDAARELLLNRCFVRYPKGCLDRYPEGSAEDEYPYAWRMAVRSAGSLWPLADYQVVPFGDALHAIGIPTRDGAG